MNLIARNLGRSIGILKTAMFACVLAVVLMPSRLDAAATALDEAVGDAADQIATAIRERSDTIAVPDLSTLDGRVTVLGRYVAEELVTALFARGASVVERSLLDRTFSELEMGMTDLMNPAEVKRFGRLVGAQAIIVGTLTDLGQTIKLNARVVEVETGQVIGAAATVVQKEASVETMLAQDVPARKLKRPTPRSEQGQSPQPKADPIFFSEDFSRYDNGDPLPAWGPNIIVRRFADGRSWLGSQVPGTHVVRQSVGYAPDFTFEFDIGSSGDGSLEFSLVLVDEKGDELRIDCTNRPFWGEMVVKCPE